MSSLTITEKHLQQLLYQVVQSEAGTGVAAELYPAEMAQGCHWLVSPSAEATGKRPKAPGTLVFWKQEDPQSLPLPFLRALQTNGERKVIGLELCGERGEPHFLLHERSSEAEGRIQSLQIVGAGIQRLEHRSLPDTQEVARWVQEKGIYSRLIGTLGLKTFKALQEAHIAIVGTGGTGSLMAETLSRYLTSRACLTLIDPDSLHSGNLLQWGRGEVEGEVSATSDKVERLATRLCARPEAPFVLTVKASITAWESLRAIKEADVVICCVDNPVARRAIAFLTTLYHKPLLDIGTAVFLGEHQEDHALILERSARVPFRVQGERGQLPRPLLSDQEPRLFGADVRLIVPGEGCLLCQGGIGNSGEVPRREPRPFWRQRAGTSYHWNLSAVSEACDLLLTFLKGDLTSSVHRQRTHHLGALSPWREVEHSSQDCPFCALGGTGDTGIALYTKKD